MEDLLTDSAFLTGIAAGLALVLVVAILLIQLRGKKKFLNPTQFQPLTLIDKKTLSHNSYRFRFGLPQSDMILGLPIGQHISFMYTDESGKQILRSYTPVTDDRTTGFVDFVIKVYEKGQMSVYVDNLKIGESLMMRGPKGRFLYRPNMKRHFGMLAGGTGITPMYQVAQAILSNPKDKTKISLIYGNLTVDDILLREELELMAKERPDQFSVYFVVDKQPEENDWKGGVGYITADIIKEHSPAPADDIMVLRCGPQGMNIAMGNLLTQLGYTDDMLFKF
eukprot:TRINITY_DN5241_c0_g2_i1.p1 TRINITY_DN5241_c0_g2~~TRINITY_DN5241_c0_g2_i1.p1  ORF type:complete len:297 (-),score=19.16 TRINITY_DN5241_c0_g2_i1:589-1428(-)